MYFGFSSLIQVFKRYMSRFWLIVSPKKVPKDFENDFGIYHMNKTIGRIRSFSMLIFPTQLLMILSYAYMQRGATSRFWLYATVSATYLLALLVSERLTAKIYSKIEKNLFFLEITAVLFLCVVSAGQIYNLAVYMNTSFAAYQLCITIAIIALMPAYRTKRLYAATGLMYAVLIGVVFAFNSTDGYGGDISYVIIFAAAAAMEAICDFSRANVTDVFMSQTIMKNTNLKLEEANSKLFEMNEALEKLSTTDQLTGIANRRAFDDYISKAWNDCRRLQKPVTVMMMDIDHFKAFNDFYGHLEGDECLRTIAETARGSFKRSTDMFARYGGEEFVAVMPFSGGDAVAAIAEKVRMNIENLKIPNPGSKTTPFVTISIGVACIVPDSELAQEQTPEWLVELADKALYQAKNGGRNKVVAIFAENEGEIDGNTPDADHFALGRDFKDGTDNVHKAEE